MELTAANLKTVIIDSLYRDEEVTGVPKDGSAKPEHFPEGTVFAEGVMNQFAFHPGRLESHREDVKSMLEQLEPEFFVGSGDGMSLMRMPFTKDGHQYGEQRDADILYVLGNALGYCKWVLPRQMWAMLPGGMPYIQINLEGLKENDGGPEKDAEKAG